jgi:hypothetical protein
VDPRTGSTCGKVFFLFLGYDIFNTSIGSQKRVVGDSLLCASFLSYCGPFSFEYLNVCSILSPFLFCYDKSLLTCKRFRHAMVYGEWYEDLLKRGIPVTTPFRLETLLTSEVEISKWASGTIIPLLSPFTSLLTFFFPFSFLF